MSDKLQHIDIDSEEFEDAPRGLREYAKKLKAAYDSVSADYSKARKQLASRAVSDVLADKGFKNPKRVERDLLADDIDPYDSKAVEEWISANGDDYAKGAANPEPVQSPESAQNAELAEQYNRMNVGGEANQPAPNDKWAAVQAEITPDMDGAAVIEVYKRHGLA